MTLKFASTMSSNWSGDVDSELVVFSERPVWRMSTDSPSSCLLFLAWGGLINEQLG